MFIKKYIPSPIIDIFKFNWTKNISTPIHDHAKYGCVMFLFKGKLKEHLYDKNYNVKKTSIYSAPNISYINNKIGYHSVTPLEDSKSIHFYFPKGHKTKYYNLDKNES
tara:strand:- start:9151 stop:9474 length:324 start_codon:yes stop_codon:yes gene_type:complete